MEPNEMVEQCMAILKEDPVYKFAQELMSQAEAMESEQAPPEEMGGQDMTGAPQGQAEPPPAEEPADNQGGSEMPPEETNPGEEEEAPIQKAASCASGGNTYVPGMGEKKKMSRQHTLEERLAASEAANEQLVIKFARSARKADLLGLQAQGIDLDLDEELNVVAPEDNGPMDEKAYKGYLDRIVKRYQRAPVNQAMIVTRSGPMGNVKERVAEAVELATEKGISFADAYKQVSE